MADAWGRDARAVATRLRALIDRVEDGTLGALSLDILGDVFGNEFWNLVLLDATEHQDLLNSISAALGQVTRALESHTLTTWPCRCGWINGSNLPICARCGSSPALNG